MNCGIFNFPSRVIPVWDASYSGAWGSKNYTLATILSLPDLFISPTPCTGLSLATLHESPTHGKIRVVINTGTESA